jgi:hypothetical protein
VRGSQEGDDQARQPATDAELVGVYMTAAQDVAAAQQRESRARDQSERVWQPVRQLDWAAQAAGERLEALNRVQEANVHWEESRERARELVTDVARYRDQARGRGPGARAAGRRAEELAAQAPGVQEEMQGWARRTTELAAAAGFTLEPEKWQRMREDDTALLRGYTDRRAELVAGLGAPAAESRWAYEAAQAATAAELVQRDAVVADLRARLLDVDRVHEVSLRITRGGVPETPSDPRTEAAITTWERAQDAQLAAGVDAGEREDQAARQQPAVEHRGGDLDR